MIKLLVIEDDKTLFDNMKEIVSEIGDVTQAYDGSEGLYEAETGIYDLIILDLMMPEMCSDPKKLDFYGVEKSTPFLYDKINC